MAKSEMTDSEEDGKKSMENTFGCESSKKKPKKKSSDLTTENSSDSRCLTPFRNVKQLEGSTQISLVMAALLKTAAALIEPDEAMKEIKLRELCRKFYEMGWMDESYNMKEFDSCLTQFQKHLFDFLKPRGSNSITINPSFSDNMSRCAMEFEELEYIAGGGFGKVYKAKHKLDSMVYAVKKIRIRDESIQYVKNYLAEVKTFSSLNHPNIVQYKAAWLEMNDTDKDPQEYDSDDSYLIPSEIPKHHETEEYVYNTEISKLLPEKADDSSDFEVVFEHSVNNMESQQIKTSGTFDKKQLKREKRISVSEGGDSICPLSLREIQEVKTQLKKQERWVALYIQMSYCPRTLKQWLTERNAPRNAEDIDPMKAVVPVKHVEDSVVKEILIQLLGGLEYLHAKDMVHHDVKPSNIFLQIDNGKILAQLGDFGLACPKQRARHSLAFGTRLYAAPEQLAGLCNSKSDMYSLGVVLFELVETFTTEMELNKNMEEVKRTGHLPLRVMIQHPEFADIIQRLLVSNPDKRPSAHDLLQELSGNSPSADMEIKELKSQLAEKDKEIMMLKEMLKNVGLASNGN